MKRESQLNPSPCSWICPHDIDIVLGKRNTVPESMQITYCRLNVQLRAREPFEEPAFLGNILRGVLGISLRRVLCTTGLGSCDTCPVRTACWFEYLFESKTGNTSDFPMALETAPHPFVIEIPPESMNLEAGAALNFVLILFGRAIDSAPYWMLAINELCRMGLGRERIRFDLVSMSGADGQIVYDSKSGKMTEVAKQEWIYSSDGAKVRGCTIEFRTPCRIRHDGKLSDRFEFNVLLTNILRRASAISYFHCGRTPSLDFRALIERAKDVRIESSQLLWSEKPRFSSRQKAHMSLGGVTGQIVYRGELTEFTSLLRFGELAHIGKATAFGMGQYRCSVIP
jgi:hypothetical protein